MGIHEFKFFQNPRNINKLKQCQQNLTALIWNISNMVSSGAPFCVLHNDKDTKKMNSVIFYYRTAAPS